MVPYIRVSFYAVLDAKGSVYGLAVPLVALSNLGPVSL